MADQPTDEVYLSETWGKADDGQPAVDYAIAPTINQYSEWIKLTDVLLEDSPYRVVIPDGYRWGNLPSWADAEDEDDPVWTDV